MVKKRFLRRLIAASAAGWLGAAQAQTPAPSADAVVPSLAAPMTSTQVIQVLDQTIDWYRTLGVQQQAANEPSDLLILYDNRQTANQVLSSAFDIARANAELLAKQAGNKEPAAAGASQTLNQLQGKFAAQALAVQAELDSDRSQMPKASAEQRPQLQAKVAELQGELDLINVRRTLLASMAAFSLQSDNTGFSADALKAQIDAMAVTTPGAPASAAPPAGAAAGGTSATDSPTALGGISGVAAARFGIWDLAANVIRLSEKAATVTAIDQRTAALQSTFTKLRDPLIAQLKKLSAQGDALAAQADGANLDQVRNQLDALSNEFKESSALLIPLSREGTLLSQYRRNLGNWHEAIKNQYHNALKTLGVRAGVLALLLALVFAAAEIWRAAVLRYIQDSRRRYQFLLLRRIALWSLVVIIVGFAFASELGSVVTFAGLITAGLAVAMQSVLVSIVGYFFLIGKFGIRVGDHVQVGEVTGEVIDLGLVRLHLMELGAHGTTGPTGRVVAFPNSIVFQVTSGLFKQIHGVSLVWHEITLALPASVDFAAAKARLAAAVTGVLKDDRAEIVRQTREIEKATASNFESDAQPRVQLSYSASGVDAHIRYPVHMQNAADIDERVSQAVFGVVRELAAATKPGHPA